MGTLSRDGSAMGLAARLKQARLAAGAGTGIGQEDLANRVSVSQASISDYERGRRRPSLGVLIAIARELDITPSWLLEGRECPTEPLGRTGVLSCTLGELLGVIALVHLGTAGLVLGSAQPEGEMPGGSALAAEGQAPYGSYQDSPDSVVVLDQAIAGHARWAITYAGPETAQLCQGDLLLIAPDDAPELGQPIIWLMTREADDNGPRHFLKRSTAGDSAPAGTVGRVSRIVRALD